MIKAFASRVRKFGFDAIENKVLSGGAAETSVRTTLTLSHGAGCGTIQIKWSCYNDSQQRRFRHIGYVRFHRLLKRRSDPCVQYSRLLFSPPTYMSFSGIVRNFDTEISDVFVGLIIVRENI